MSEKEHRNDYLAMLEANAFEKLRADAMSNA
jgi:hypothetical protein